MAAAPDDEDGAQLRPAWEDTEDETDADRLGITRGRRSATDRGGPAAWVSDADLRALLGPLCAATDMLARLDARAAASPAAVRDGLIARMAVAEAAGWLAHAHAWVHPLDLALRDLGLTAPAALAAVGAGHRALPQTFAGPAEPRDWADPPFEAMAEGDRAVAEALALARLLHHLAGNAGGSMFAQATEAAETLASLGAGGLDQEMVAA